MCPPRRCLKCWAAWTFCWTSVCMGSLYQVRPVSGLDRCTVLFWTVFKCCFALHFLHFDEINHSKTKFRKFPAGFQMRCGVQTLSEALDLVFCRVRGSSRNGRCCAKGRSWTGWRETLRSSASHSSSVRMALVSESAGTCFCWSAQLQTPADISGWQTDQRFESVLAWNPQSSECDHFWPHEGITV